MNDINTTDYASKLVKLEAGIADARNAIYQQALSIAEEFHERRKEISEGFSNINVQVRSRHGGRSIHIGWSIFHFKNGFKTGAVSVRKRRGVSL
ncbi:MAG TPA: hypothetical protein VGD21_04105 [Lysobacter sp.]